MSKKRVLFSTEDTEQSMEFLTLSLPKELTCVNFCFVLLEIFNICVRISTHFTDKWSFT